MTADFGAIVGQRVVVHLGAACLVAVRESFLGNETTISFLTGLISLISSWARTLRPDLGFPDVA